MKTKQELREEIQQLPEFELTPLYLEESKLIKNLLGVRQVNTDFVVTAVTPRYELVQFKSIFLPALESIDETTGHLWNFGGRAILSLFPEGEEYKLANEDQIGIIVKNSVDKSTSVEIKFSVLYGEEKLFVSILPVSGLKSVHAGDPLSFSNDFLNLLNKVKEMWKTIALKSQEMVVDNGLAISICDEMKIGKKMTKEILFEVASGKVTLWDLFIKIMREVSQKDYKSGIHKAKKIEEISKALCDYLEIRLL